MRPLLVVGGVVAALVATASPADAKERELTAEEKKVKAHFKQGVAYQEAGQYDLAIREFEEGYATKPFPAFLFNIGRCYHLKGDARRAVEYYRKFLEQQPEGDVADEARGYVTELGTKVHQEEEAEKAKQTEEARQAEEARKTEEARQAEERAKASPATGTPAASSAVQTRDDGPIETVSEPVLRRPKASFALGVSAGPQMTFSVGTPQAYSDSTEKSARLGGHVLVRLDWRPEDVVGVRAALVLGIHRIRYEQCASVCQELGDIGVVQVGAEIGPHLSFSPERTVSKTFGVGIGVARLDVEAVDGTGATLETLETEQLHAFAGGGYDFRIGGGTLSLEARFDAGLGDLGGQLDASYVDLGVSLGFALRL